MLRRFFQLDRLHTSVKIECIAGLTTFLTMVYILLVNPAILAKAGIDPRAAFVATALTAAFGSILCGLLSNLPIAIAPAMALNAYFTFVVVNGLGYSWQVALGAVFIAGIIFLLLTLVGIRQWIIDVIPLTLHVAIATGIGLFIGVIALKELGIIVPDPITLVKLGNLLTPQIALGFLGFCLIVVLDQKGYRGSFILSIFLITLISIMLGYTQITGVLAWPTGLENSFLQLRPKVSFTQQDISVIFTFLLVALFDSTGTLIGLLQQAKFTDKYHRDSITQALLAEGSATVVGSVLGTSTTSPFIESAAGIQAGGKSGLTACVVGMLFLLMLFFSPIAAAVPVFAYAPALLYVACKMFDSVTLLNWKDATETIPSIITIIMIPLTFSIADGIAIGFATYLVLKLLGGKWRELKPGIYVISIISILFLAFAGG